MIFFLTVHDSLPRRDLTRLPQEEMEKGAELMPFAQKRGCVFVGDRYLPGYRLLDPGELAVFDPVRLGGRGAKAGLPVRLGLGVVSVKPDGRALPLEGQDGRGGPVQEPAVVADDDRAAAEILQGLLDGAHRDRKS